MKRFALIMVLLSAGLALAMGAGLDREPVESPIAPAVRIDPDVPERSGARFEAIELFVDSGSQPLAAYQLEFKATAGNVKIVGIEGGEHLTFAAAPYYDPAAMQQERVIIAAFSTRPAETLPVGRTRVATVHVMVSGAVIPAFDLLLSATAAAHGGEIAAQGTFQTGSIP